ncbi:MAG: hypothetical protein JXA92_02575 [candidate division Zixibacteria bacterium]|nr:hypothetical protein [candidate division Zixibacteria bacterium]
MATKQKDEKNIFPRVPSKNWWDLRKKATQTVPRKITRDYLMTVLEIGEGAAQNLSFIVGKSHQIGLGIITPRQLMMRLNCPRRVDKIQLDDGIISSYIYDI